MSKLVLKRRGVPYQSRMTQILNVDLSDFFKEVKHIFVVGMSGSGKTSSLLLLTYWFYQNGEIIIWRDDSSLEFLSLKEIIPWKIFVPQGCTLKYPEGKNVEFAEFDPWHLKTLFQQIDKDKGNAILFDLFTFDMTMFISFWSRVFYGLYKWKRTRIRERISFVTDELNDLAPSTRRGYIPRQLALSSNIYFSQKKFRKEGVRLVASAHAYGDVHKPVREGFNYYIIKRCDPGSVPERFMQYSKVIEKLQIDEWFIVDEKKSFNKITVDEIVKPRKIAASWTGNVIRQTEKKAQEMAMWQRRAAIAGKVLMKGLGFTLDDLATLYGYAARSSVHQLMDRKLSDADLAIVEKVLSKIPAENQSEALKEK